MMKKAAFVIVGIILLMAFNACSGPGWEEIKKEKSSYENFSHMFFSWTHKKGDTDVTEEDVKRSKEQGWFGETLVYEKK